MTNGRLSNAAEVRDHYRGIRISEGTALEAAKVLMAAAVVAADADGDAAAETITAVDAAGAAIAALTNG